MYSEYIQYDELIVVITCIIRILLMIMTSLTTCNYISVWKAYSNILTQTHIYTDRHTHTHKPQLIKILHLHLLLPPHLVKISIGTLHDQLLLLI